MLINASLRWFVLGFESLELTFKLFVESLIVVLYSTKNQTKVLIEDEKHFSLQILV